MPVLLFVNFFQGSLIIKNWKPIPLEHISDNPVVPVCDIIGELTSVVTLRIVILRCKPSPFGEIKDKLLKLLVLQSHAVLRSTGCPLDEVSVWNYIYIHCLVSTHTHTNVHKIRDYKSKCRRHLKFYPSN